jgi:pseudouridylate synthase
MKIEYSDKVVKARLAGKSLVALESTIISHGFPYPVNLDLAADMENTVEAEGAVPATIAILNGVVKVGLEADELEQLAKGDGISKTSVRDLGFILAQKKSGATTVASTAFIAEKAGIRVFATGGIGGVHRAEEGANGFDISADLIEMSRTKIAIISAGAKSLLDLRATMEVLESYSVPVVGYQTTEFPAFHTRTSGLALQHSVSNLKELTLLTRQHFELDVNASLLICNPIAEEFAMTEAEIEALIMAAQAEATTKKITGAALTPYVLGALNRLSDGKTSVVNRVLALGNAKLAAQLAVRMNG